MKSSLVVTTLLCFTTWMSLAFARPGESCCVSWSKTRVPLDRIVNYAIQSEDACRIKAVRLRTVLGKTICTDPNADWTIKAMEWVDKKKAPTTSTTTTSTPTTSTTTKKAPTTSTASPTSGNISQKDKETGQSLTMLCQIHCCVVPWTKTMLCPTN
ncbi:eotaxin-like [Haplochromis burtoni]|uniref:eotaxin-like n=1 Tax=Haplochromis burtoni TaxID=8153 RepID=UPI001C2DC4C3|nr:eotaxin-like [Haplochromis burtoni]